MNTDLYPPEFSKIVSGNCENVCKYILVYRHMHTREQRWCLKHHLTFGSDSLTLKKEEKISVKLFVTLKIHYQATNMVAPLGNCVYDLFCVYLFCVYDPYSLSKDTHLPGGISCPPYHTYSPSAVQLAMCAASGVSLETCRPIETRVKHAR